MTDGETQPKRWLAAVEGFYGQPLTHEARPTSVAFTVMELWRRARERNEEVFGIRWAWYPVTTWNDVTHALPESVVISENLTDRLYRAALGLS